MVLALFFPALLWVQSPMPAASPDPYSIYRSAMAHLATLQQPRYIIDTEHWVTLVTIGQQDNAQSSEWNENRIFDSQTRRECVLDVPLTRRPPQIGQSEFAPDSWLIDHFGTRASQRKTGASNLQPDLSDLATIASAVAVARPSYDIDLLGIDSLTDGGPAYHLRLRPRFNPKMHNLRQLWVDTRTDAIVRAVIEGDYEPNYHSMPDDTFVTEDFGQVGPYWLVIHHAWTYQQPFSNIRYQYDATSTSMRFPDTLPSWFFDFSEFPKHFGEVNSYVGCDASNEPSLAVRFRMGIAPCPGTGSRSAAQTPKPAVRGRSIPRDDN